MVLSGAQSAAVWSRETQVPMEYSTSWTLRLQPTHNLSPYDPQWNIRTLTCRAHPLLPCELAEKQTAQGKQLVMILSRVLIPRRSSVKIVYFHMDLVAVARLLLIAPPLLTCLWIISLFPIITMCAPPQKCVRWSSSWPCTMASSLADEESVLSTHFSRGSGPARL